MGSPALEQASPHLRLIARIAQALRYFAAVNTTKLGVGDAAPSAGS
jgi:hypothetical protein